MPSRNRAQPLRSGSAFTLIELLLAVVLLGLLLGAVAFNFDSLRRGRSLEEGASQFESLIRLARAHAALSGHPVVIALIPATNSIEPDSDAAFALAVLSQPDPLRNPGMLVAIPSVQSHLPPLAELVQLQVTLTNEPSPSINPPALDSSAVSSSTNANPVSRDAASDEAPVPDEHPEIRRLLTFQPDGSSDAADFILVSLEPEDPRRLLIHFDPLLPDFQRRYLKTAFGSSDTAAEDPEMENPEESDPSLDSGSNERSERSSSTNSPPEPR
jgi:prepilin-type N-terminal cleavage/methylation domain-containing protein